LFNNSTKPRLKRVVRMGRAKNAEAFMVRVVCGEREEEKGG
jgi:hypothetical protein